MQTLRQNTDLDGHPLSRTLQEHPPTLHAPSTYPVAVAGGREGDGRYAG